jgi:hypothetical protein
MTCALIVGVNNLVEQSIQPPFYLCGAVRFNASARAVQAGPAGYGGSVHGGR